MAEDLLDPCRRHRLILFRLIGLSRLEGIDDTEIVGGHEVIGAANRSIDPRHQPRQQQFITTEQDVVSPRFVFDARLEILKLWRAELDAGQRWQRIRTLQQFDHRQIDSGDGGDMVVVEGSFRCFLCDMLETIDQHLDGSQGKIRRRYNSDRIRPHLFGMNRQSARIAEAVVTHMNHYRHSPGNSPMICRSHLHPLLGGQRRGFSGAPAQKQTRNTLPQYEVTSSGYLAQIDVASVLQRGEGRGDQAGQ